jgi:hypothetical protein
VFVAMCKRLTCHACPQGNHWCTRDYGESGTGHHYSNKFVYLTASTNLFLTRFPSEMARITIRTQMGPNITTTGPETRLSQPRMAVSSSSRSNSGVSNGWPRQGCNMVLGKFTSFRTKSQSTLHFLIAFYMVEL